MDLRQGRPYDRAVTDEADDEGSKAKPTSAADEAEAKKVDKDNDPSSDKDSDMAAAEANPLDPHAPMTYPDDGPVSETVRKIDNTVGMVEQIVLVTILSIVVLTAAGHAISDRFFHYHVPFKDDVIRAGTFAIAMLAGAFASHQAKHLSMDLISRRLSPRARLFLKVFLGLFVIFMVALLIRSGFHNIDNEKQFAAEDKLITRVRIAWLIPIGGFLIIFHTLLHAIIDVDYILRRKTPPERMRSGH